MTRLSQGNDLIDERLWCRDPAVAAFSERFVRRWRLRQQRCLEVASRPSHVGLVDGTRRTYRHYGRQRSAPRRIATFHHATLCVAPYRYATREPPGDIPAALARLARTVRLMRSSAMAFEGDVTPTGDKGISRRL